MNCTLQNEKVLRQYSIMSKQPSPLGHPTGNPYLYRYQKILTQVLQWSSLRK